MQANTHTRRASISLATILALTVPGAAAATASEQPVTLPTAHITQALNTFVDTQETVLTGTQSRQRAARSTTYTDTSDAATMRTDFQDAGLEITQANSTLNIEDTLSTTPTTTVVAAELTTTVISTDEMGQEIESSWTDRHIYELQDVNGTLTIVGDTIDNIIPGENEAPNEGEPIALPEDASRDEAPAQGAEIPMPRSQPKLNVTKFSNYASKYTSLGYTTVAQGNPSYKDLGNNCANFASQALRAGGWELKNGVNPYDLNNWHYDLSGKAGPSRTWSKASYLFGHVRDKQKWNRIDNKYNLVAGDLLFADWDPKGTPDGVVDHVMVVSKRDAYSMPYISQKTPNRHNVPLSVQVKRAESQKKAITWFARRHK